MTSGEFKFFCWGFCTAWLLCSIVWALSEMR